MDTLCSKTLNIYGENNVYGLTEVVTIALHAWKGYYILCMASFGNCLIIRKEQTSRCIDHDFIFSYTNIRAIYNYLNGGHLAHIWSFSLISMFDPFLHGGAF